MVNLHAGVSQKVGLPGFSSASASCTVEPELDSSLLQGHEGFQVVVQRAYASGEKAVEDQIAWLTSDDQTCVEPQEVVEGAPARPSAALADLLPVLTPTKPASTNPASKVAKKLAGRDYVSCTALSTFRTCPLNYKFRHIDGLPESSVSSTLRFGTGIHAAVKQHYQTLLSGDPKPDLDALLLAYRSAWLPHDPDAIQFGSKEIRKTLDGLAARMLTGFLASDSGLCRRNSQCVKPERYANRFVGPAFLIRSRLLFDLSGDSVEASQWPAKGSR